jgi:hypothetical protein
MDSVELARDAVAGAVAVVEGLTTTALGAVEADAVGLVEVELIDVELVDVELVVDELESSDPLAQARPVARSTAVTAAAAKGIRYLINDPPFGLEGQCSGSRLRGASARGQGNIKSLRYSGRANRLRARSRQHR